MRSFMIYSFYCGGKHIMQCNTMMIKTCTNDYSSKTLCIIFDAHVNMIFLKSCMDNQVKLKLFQFGMFI